MVIEKIAQLLLKNKTTIAVAESCTGGLICHALTNTSGSSKYFKLGLILYSDDAKSKFLGIKKQDLKQSGAVSEKIAIIMAKKVKALAKTDIGLSTTGIAGPTGGSKENPLGTVYIVLSYKNITAVEQFRFTGTRIQIKNKAKNKALLLVKQCLKNP